MNDEYLHPKNVLFKYGFDLTEDDIVKMWDKPHRFYHTSTSHLFPMLAYVINIRLQGNLTTDEYDAMVIATYFHDIVYNPKSKTNEEDSVKCMYEHCKTKFDVLKIAETLILETKDHKPSTALSKTFCKADFETLTHSVDQLIVYEEQIFKEYEFVNWNDYKINRVKLLKSFIDDEILEFNSYQKTNIEILCKYIENRKPRIGVYAGSFNPFHIGHVDIVRQAKLIFDKVIIAKGINPDKRRDDLATINTLRRLEELYPTMEIVKYEGLLTEFLKKQDVDVTLIRGLRDGYDLYEETKLRMYMQDMYPELKVVYLPCHPSLAHISSSSIRMVQGYDKELAKKYLP